jgi:hypothetical protein
MGKDRYHYDANGKYKGKSSNDPPGSGCLALIGLAVMIALLGYGGLNKKDKPKNQPDIILNENGSYDNSVASAPDLAEENQSVSETVPLANSESQTDSMKAIDNVSELRSEPQIIFAPKKEVVQPILSPQESEYPPCSDALTDNCIGN